MSMRTGRSASRARAAAMCGCCFSRLDEKLRRGMVPAFDRVVVDASEVGDVQGVIDALVPGRQPAVGLRDHTVARNFRLAE